MNVKAKNRPSPPNEDEYRAAYKKLNPDSEKKDGLDIACVTTMLGTNGHGLMDESENRSHDNKYHDVYDFISDIELELEM